MGMLSPGLDAVTLMGLWHTGCTWSAFRAYWGVCPDGHAQGQLHRARRTPFATRWREALQDVLSARHRHHTWHVPCVGTGGPISTASQRQPLHYLLGQCLQLSRSPRTTRPISSAPRGLPSPSWPAADKNGRRWSGRRFSATFEIPTTHGAPCKWVGWANGSAQPTHVLARTRRQRCQWESPHCGYDRHHHMQSYRLATVGP